MVQIMALLCLAVRQCDVLHLMMESSSLVLMRRTQSHPTEQDDASEEKFRHSLNQSIFFSNHVAVVANNNKTNNNAKKRTTTTSPTSAHSCHKLVLKGAKEKEEFQLPPVQSCTGMETSIIADHQMVVVTDDSKRKKHAMQVAQDILHFDRVDTANRVNITEGNNKRKVRNTNNNDLEQQEKQEQINIHKSQPSSEVEEKELQQKVMVKRTKKKILPQLDVEVQVRHRAVLNALGQLEVVQIPEYALVEKFEEVSVNPLRLFFLRQAADYQERPMMPCTNVNFLIDNVDHKHGYEEPIRDRDKNWRELMWTDIAPTLIPFDVAEKQRLEEEQTILAMEARKVFEDGVLMNKLLILRQGVRIGEYGMLVSIFGMGIAGRVYMKNTRFPRHLRVEAYSPRLQEHYILRISLDDLEELVRDEIHLLNPGHKRELCEYILKLLYIDPLEDKLCVSRVATETGHSALHRRKRRWEQHVARQAALDRISKYCTQRYIDDQNDLIGLDDDDEGKTRAKPWLRLQGLITSHGMKLSGYYVVLTVHSQPRKRSTLIIRAYDPPTCQYFELLVSTRELGKVLGDRKDPELWDEKRKKYNCEQMMMNFLSLEILNKDEMALSFDGRLGIAGPTIRKVANGSGTRIQGRRHALLQNTSAFENAQAISMLQVLSAQANPQRLRNSVVLRNPGGRRKGQVLNAKLPRRDIGHGFLIFRGLYRISSQNCIVTVYYQTRDSLLFSVYCIATSQTDAFVVQISEFESLLRDQVSLYEKFTALDLSRCKHGEEVKHFCKTLMDQRVTLFANKLHFSREIYRRGHKLRDLRVELTTSRHTHCIVSVEQGPGWLTFNIYDRITTKCIEFKLPDELTTELLHELQSISALERQIHLGVTINSFALELNDLNQTIIMLT